ncbi:ROK family protein [Streptacidiphilus sp. P02-A3a]|nr:ROK family protein [Streptacidiphilus sp. P02-A3a]
MDIGGTHVTAARAEVGAGGVVLGRPFREPLDSGGGTEEILGALVRCAELLPADSGGRWCVALPGPFDYDRGVGRFHGVGKFDALRGFDLRTALLDRLPGARSVRFCNDADAFLLGEWRAGSARGHRSVAGVTLGTGVGSGFLRDGRLLRQGDGIPPEGRVDLLRYAGRPLEETVSRHALRRAYARAAGLSAAPDVREIAERARQGDATALGVLTRTFHALGTALGPCLAAFAPSVLVIGGSIAGAWDLLADPIRSGVAEAGPGTGGTAIVPALLPARAPLLGAAYLGSSQGKAKGAMA